MNEEVPRLNLGTHREGVPDGGVTQRFGALFTRPAGVRVSLDRFDELDFGRCEYIGESGGRAAARRRVGREHT